MFEKPFVELECKTRKHPTYDIEICSVHHEKLNQDFIAVIKKKKDRQGEYVKGATKQVWIPADKAFGVAEDISAIADSLLKTHVKEYKEKQEEKQELEAKEAAGEEE